VPGNMYFTTTRLHQEMAGGIFTDVICDEAHDTINRAPFKGNVALKAVLPLVKEHGAAVIALCMDDDGIPEAAEGRLRVGSKIIERAAKMGIPLENVVVDPLALTMGADSNAGRVALDAIGLLVKEFGVNITMGASNISFGMPDRKYINSTFIAMAIHAGMTCPITNPLVPEVNLAILAADLAMGRDEYGMRWIQAFRARQG